MTAQEKALATYGIANQRIKLAEECAELAAAALHLQTCEDRERLENLFEEIADVEIMIEQMRHHYGDLRIEAWRASKLTRLEKRLSIKATDYTLAAMAGHKKSGPKAPGEIPEPKPVEKPVPKRSLPKPPKPKTGKKGGSRKPIPVWVDGVKFASVHAVKRDLGLDIAYPVRMKKSHHQGHKLAYEAPEAKAIA